MLNKGQDECFDTVGSYWNVNSMQESPTIRQFTKDEITMKLYKGQYECLDTAWACWNVKSIKENPTIRQF